jgi:hypothetical protein
LTWWYILVIPALARLRQEVHKFKTSLVYIVRHCQKKKQTKKQGGWKRGSSGKSTSLASRRPGSKGGKKGRKKEGKG